MIPKLRRAGLALSASLALWSCAHPPPTSVAVTRSVYLTFYGWPDNSPPGDKISYGAHAGGTGTYANPITLATDKRELPVGTRVYVPYLQKYFIMEDDCTECITDWTSQHKYHFDLWIGGKGVKSETVLAQESKLTRDDRPTVIVNPSPNEKVDVRPLLQY